MSEYADYPDYGGDGNDLGCLGVLIILAVLYFLFFKDGNGIFNYEGQTAEDWYNEYDACETYYANFRECVEEYDSFDIQKQMRYRGALNYCD